MTLSELCKLHELAGRLQARATILESDVKATSDLITRLETEAYQEHFRGQLHTLESWSRSNASILADVERIIKEAEDV